ncbi:MAG: hypothetical protein BWY76_00973 [bacterium ADurb.Bin429]|nr:MAG: hypothetical protein BWY76_00973 [bacterium ADurb.Bin429]
MLTVTPLPMMLIDKCIALWWGIRALQYPLRDHAARRPSAGMHRFEQTNRILNIALFKYQ